MYIFKCILYAACCDLVSCWSLPWSCAGPVRAQVIFAACQPVPSNPIRGMATRCWFVNNAMDGLKSYVYEGLSLDSMRRNKLLTVLQDRLEPIVPVDGLSVNFLLELSQGATGGEVLRSKLLYRVHDRWQPDAACTEVVSDERPGTEAELRDWTNKHLKSSQHAASHKTWSDRMTTRLGTLIDIPDAAEANKLVYVVDKVGRLRVFCPAALLFCGAFAETEAVTVVCRAGRGGHQRGSHARLRLPAEGA